MTFPRAKLLAAAWIGALGATTLLGIDAGPVRAYHLYPSVVFPARLTLALAVEQKADGTRAVVTDRPLDADSLAKVQLRPGGISLEEADARIRQGAALYPGRKLTLIHRTILRDERGVTIRDEEPTGPAL